MRKKGDIEILSTILLMSLVIMIGVVVFIYAKKNTSSILETTEKLDNDLGVSSVCNDVVLKIICACPDVTAAGDSLCYISIANNAQKEIKEVAYTLYLNQEILASSKSQVNIAPLGGDNIKDILIRKNSYATTAEVHPIKVIFNNKEINCGNKVSIGGCVKP